MADIYDPNQMPFDPTSGVMDLILGIAAVLTLVALVRAWRTFWDEDFTLSDRRLGAQVAVFVIPPAVVLLHELGHLFAARALGVDVAGFHYGLFEGSVTITGPRTPAQDWVIALAGNAVSAVVGFLMVAAGIALTRLRRPARYVLVAGGLLELVFALVAYPLLSLTSRFGDWIVIYDRRRTPGLSTAAALVHAAVLLALVVWWRRRGRAALFEIASGTEGEVAALRRAIDASPGDPGPWLALADFYARRGELALARSTVEDGVAACGDAPRLLLGLARLSMFQGRWNDVVVAARRGLDAATAAGALDEGVVQPLWANLALALTQMERPDHALSAYEQVSGPLADDVRVRYGRGLMRLEAGDDAGGRADLEKVVDRLPEDNLLRRWAEARLAGHTLRDWDDPRVPSYRRGSSPPPAPLAGL